MNSQNTQSQSSQHKQLASQDLKALADDVLLYILTQDHNKHAIKRQDIVKNIMPNQRGGYKQVMEEVKKELQDVFGLRLEELDQARYILVNKFNPKPNHHVMLPKEIRSQKVLLMLVLSYIFMSGGTVKEVNMMQFLEQLYIYNHKKGESNPYFGDVYKLLTKEFVSQLYLDYRRHPNSDPPFFEFHMGKRATAEVSLRSLLEFVSKIYDSPMKTWSAQYKEVLDEEEKSRN